MILYFVTLASLESLPEAWMEMEVVEQVGSELGGSFGGSTGHDPQNFVRK